MKHYGWGVCLHGHSEATLRNLCRWISHYNDVIMGAMASQITGGSIVYSSVYSGADHRKHQSSASLTLVRGIHRWPVNSPHKGPVTRNMFPFDDVIMSNLVWADNKTTTEQTHQTYVHISWGMLYLQNLYTTVSIYETVLTTARDKIHRAEHIWYTWA